ncbi:ParB N-terminal domain-containing protein [Streptomyces sp. NPDC051001]|uniref:ParB/RepB/Spo0J family partition protein n=1 Tax=Streptomyces sp. NPDC051001 TaxID=3155795 RepID=UPI0034219102
MATPVSAHPTEPDTHEEESAPQIVLLDPALVVRDEHNARETDTEPDEELIASVKEIGVEETISVRPRPDGTYGAFKGWRRAQAQQVANATAEQDGRPVRRIKAHVREDLVGRDGWNRFLSLVENKHREGMSERDILKSQKLSLIDMSDVERRQASKALGVGRNAVKQAKAAQKLDDATLRRATAAPPAGRQLPPFSRPLPGHSPHGSDVSPPCPPHHKFPGKDRKPRFWSPATARTTIRSACARAPSPACTCPHRCSAPRSTSARRSCSWTTAATPPSRSATCRTAGD